jgi:hypothetical protein
LVMTRRSARRRAKSSTSSGKIIGGIVPHPLTTAAATARTPSTAAEAG